MMIRRCSSEPLAAAYQVLKQVKVDARNWVTVLGDGRLGLLVAQVLRNAGVSGAGGGETCAEVGDV
jgi:threonine dehydrogenase-like Zn-dependent dehydrogenase